MTYEYHYRNVMLRSVDLWPYSRESDPVEKLVLKLNVLKAVRRFWCLTQPHGREREGRGWRLADAKERYALHHPVRKTKGFSNTNTIFIAVMVSDRVMFSLFPTIPMIPEFPLCFLTQQVTLRLISRLYLLHRATIIHLLLLFFEPRLYAAVILITEQTHSTLNCISV